MTDVASILSRALVIALAAGLMTACAGKPEDTGEPDAAESDGPVRLTYLKGQEFEKKFYGQLSDEPERMLIEFPGQSSNLSEIPEEVSALLDAAQENGSAIKLVAWDESVRMRSVGLLEIKAVIKGARYLRSLYEIGQAEMRRIQQRKLGDYDVDILFEPATGEIRYIHMVRTTGDDA